MCAGSQLNEASWLECELEEENGWVKEEALRKNKCLISPLVLIEEMLVIGTMVIPQNANSCNVFWKGADYLLTSAINAPRGG